MLQEISYGRTMNSFNTNFNLQKNYNDNNLQSLFIIYCIFTTGIKHN
jgi:hypothetical protein